MACEKRINFHGEINSWKSSYQDLQPNRLLFFVERSHRQTYEETNRQCSEPTTKEEVLHHVKKTENSNKNVGDMDNLKSAKLKYKIG